MNVALITNLRHRLFSDAEAICRAHSEHVMLYNSGSGTDELSKMSFDLVISFLSDLILPEPCCRGPNVNFHPAPPAYPGRGGASYA